MSASPYSSTLQRFVLNSVTSTVFRRLELTKKPGPGKTAMCYKALEDQVIPILNNSNLESRCWLKNEGEAL